MTMNNFFVPKYVYNTYLTLSYMSRKIRRAPFLNTVEVLQTGDPLNFMMLMCHREQLLNIICMLGLFEKKRLTFAITTPQLSANCEHFWSCSWIPVLDRRPKFYGHSHFLQEVNDNGIFSPPFLSLKYISWYFF